MTGSPHGRARIVVCLLLLLPLLFIPSPATAAPGDLDTTFSGDGWDFTDFALDDRGKDVAIQADGKIVIAGWTDSEGSPNGDDYAVARYNADGTLDIGFGDAGKVTTSLSDGNDRGFGVAIQPDGAIVVAGYTGTGAKGGRAFGLVRYLSDGQLDSSFGIGGQVSTNFTPRADEAAAVAIQDDGKIVAAGTAGAGDFGVARYNSDGTLDPSFSGDGRARTDFGSRDVPEGLAIKGNGMIVVSGSSGQRVAVARFKVGGGLDRSFSGDGRTVTNIGRGWGVSGGGLALHPDGKIVVAGTAAGPKFALVRYTRDGHRDRTFSGDGIRTIYMEQVYGLSFGMDVAVQPDGKIVEVGYAGDSASGFLFLALARVRSGGRLDRTFGDDGVVLTSIGEYDFGEAVALQPDGKIVVAGSTVRIIGKGKFERDFVVARYRP